MNASPAARVLDITRLVSRTGLGPLTGVDRVEMAYLTALAKAPEPLFLLCRTSYGFLLLPGTAGAALRQGLVAPDTLPAPSWPDRLRRRDAPRLRMAAALRPLALARAPHARLARLIGRHLPQGSTYINVGQTTAQPKTLARLRTVRGLRIAVMIHDTIPLDYPQFSRATEPARFAARLEAALSHADLLICNSQATADDVVRHAGTRPLPQYVVAHLGADTPPPDRAALPPGLDLSLPYFVTLGTIEPRKNHALLLDVWEQILRQMPETKAPRLFILGRRGWNNAATFQRLDSAPYMGRVVHELPGLSDGAVAALLAGAQALLMPSFAEGFGLPLIEAAALGTPIITAPLPVAHELLGEHARYAAPSSRAAWTAEIMEALAQNRHSDATFSPYRAAITIPTWTEHFRRILNKT
ncbi:glycosyltransferase family 4 protein [Phaeovulum sp.]|uniref:glycosyltransferase family 4 protein n=1 Tax=Phaeovulum sp. TaxID=2934796 RepID=UPI0039E5F581